MPIAAAGKLLLANSSETERQAAILITLSRYNAGRPLAGILNGYADEVATAEYLRRPERKLTQGVSAPNSSATWNVWSTANASPTNWPNTAVVTTEIERADRIPTKSVNDLCKKLTGMSGSIKHLYMPCECKKGIWFFSKSLFLFDILKGKS